MPGCIVPKAYCKVDADPAAQDILQAIGCMGDPNPLQDTQTLQLKLCSKNTDFQGHNNFGCRSKMQIS